MSGKPSVMTEARVRYALRADRLHKATTNKAVANRLGVNISTLRQAIYRAKAQGAR